MHEVTGDLIQMALDGEFDVIVHGCNCQNTMGSGIAKQIKKVFPTAWEADCAYSKHRSPEARLGTYSFARVGNIFVINAYTQLTFGVGERQVSYDAIDKVFSLIYKEVPRTATIGYPLIGAGLGGGDWRIISPIINLALEGRDHTLVRFSG